MFNRKQCILSESRFDFLKDLVKGIPDVSGNDDEVPTPPMTPAPSATGAHLKQETGLIIYFKINIKIAVIIILSND